jgi:hypothetical protein
MSVMHFPVAEVNMEQFGVLRHWEGLALSSSATRRHTLLDIPRPTVYPYQDVSRLQVGFFVEGGFFALLIGDKAELDANCTWMPM